MNTIKQNPDESLNSVLERARDICQRGIIYINETPFSQPNSTTRLLELCKDLILKTSRGYITYNNPNKSRNRFNVIDYEYINNLEIKENFGIDYLKSRQKVKQEFRHSTEWDPFVKAYNKLMRGDSIKLNEQIPKIMHFIYVKNPPPKGMKERMEVWQAYHPDWELKFWDDAAINKLKLINQKQYNRAQNPGEKSDIVRYEILYREGGVYIDQDIDCLGNIEIFGQLCDFWCSCALDSYFTSFNGLIASAPKHCVLEALIDEIGHLKRPAKHAEEVQENTGPYLFSRVLKKCIQQVDLLVLPPTYFFPTTVDYRGKIQPESYGNHLWGRSWVHQF